MLDFLRTTFTSAEKEDISQEKYIAESQRVYGKKATAFVIAYQ